MAVAAGAIALAVAQVVWVAAQRRGYPLDVDEAGYLTIAFNDHAGLVHGGLGGFWDAVEGQAPNAPLVPALSSLLLVVHSGIVSAFGVLAIFVVVLALAAYGIGSLLAGPRLGALAALAAAASPGALAFSHEYVFALPVAALFASALYALLRSDGLRRRGWAIGFGVLLGLMLLARTMAVAFLPGFALAAAVAIVMRVERGRRRAAAGNGALAAGALVAVASVWYAPNLGAVSSYLTSFGYGAQSAQYGAAHAPLSWSRLTGVAHTAGYESLHLSLLVALGAGALAAAVAAVWMLRSPRVPGAAAVLARSRTATVALVLLAGFLALASSRNNGDGFTLPLVVPLVALAVVGLRERPRLRAPVAALVVAASAYQVVSSSGLWSSLETPHEADLPVLGTVPVSDGRPYAVLALRQQLRGTDLRFTPADRAWTRADARLARFLVGFADAHHRAPVVAFASRNRVVDTNSVALAATMLLDRRLPVAQLTPDAGDDAAAYARFLADPQHGQPNLLVTTSSSAGDFAPRVSQRQAEIAARRDGFRPVARRTLPDGRALLVWWLDR